MPITLKKPYWLNKKINLSDCYRVKQLLGALDLRTVCREANCPNIGECFSRGEATFLILGKVCTRWCKFCAVTKGVPEAIDPKEAKHIAEAVNRLGLRHAVITSVTRDDLPDGGAGHFAGTVREIRGSSAGVAIELLIPDFKLNISALETIVRADPEIIAHNLETVPRLYASLRQGADYKRSLEVLRLIKELAEDIYTKSALMLGLGETEEEVLGVMQDLRSVACDFLSLGQYLAPSLAHYPPAEYIAPEKFAYYKEQAQGLGFRHVESAPYARSSYLAKNYINAEH